jgi:hypothetical protein
MSLQEKINRAEAYLIGNRVSVIGHSLLLGTGIFVDNLSSNMLNLTLGYSLFYSGLLLSCLTNAGKTTGDLYKRTSQHIKKFKRIDSRFFCAALGDDFSPEVLLGYCELQGMYLACRDTKPELLPEFQRLKKEKTKNIIPNF